MARKRLDVSDTGVSVLIPTRNRPKLLKRALKSIVAQSHRKLDIVIYGDACNGDTGDVVFGMHDNRIRYITGDKQVGECKARNKLVKAAKYGVICWQDDDDASNTARVSTQLRALVRSGAPYCRCGSSLIWSGSMFDNTEKPRYQSSIKFVTPTTMAWRCNALAQPYSEIMFGCDILWELGAIVRWGIGVGVPYILYYRDMTPEDRVTKVYQKRPDFDEKMAWQRAEREKLLEQVHKLGHKDWPALRRAR